MEHYILNALQKYNRQQPKSYHMPGHKGGRFLPDILKEVWGETLATFDVTEIPGLDNLHDPQEAILQSQQQAAQIFGAQTCHYLINGTTTGLQAAILANCYQKEVFVPRHCHLSILHGLILAQATIIYLPVTLDPTTHLPLGVSPDVLSSAIAKHPSCKHLIMVHPTYQGITWKNEECLSIALQNGLTVLVDEAHGAHLSFHPSLPNSLLQKGAHIVVQSWHKMLPTLTQTSAVLTHSSYQGPDLMPYLAMLETSSPSYPLMCALEACSVEMANNGADMIFASLCVIAYFQEQLQHLSTIHQLSADEWRQDPFKLNLYSDRLSGDALAEQLQNQFSLYTEMSDVNTCLLLLPLRFGKADADALLRILNEIDQQSLHLPNRAFLPAFYLSTVPQQAIPLHQAFFQPKKQLPLKDCAGNISGQWIKLYPPGIPLIMPGEIISSQVVELWLQNGASPDDMVDIIETAPTEFETFS